MAIPSVLNPGEDVVYRTYGDGLIIYNNQKSIPDDCVLYEPTPEEVKVVTGRMLLRLVNTLNQTMIEFLKTYYFIQWISCGCPISAEEDCDNVTQQFPDFVETGLAVLGIAGSLLLFADDVLTGGAGTLDDSIAVPMFVNSMQTLQNVF